MIGWSFLEKTAESVSRRIFSVPIFFKVLGIGVVVAFVFGTVTIWQTRRSVSERFLGLVEENALFAARTISTELERPMVTGSTFEIQERLTRFASLSPSIRYAIIRDADDGVVAHTFVKAIPLDLTRIFHARRAALLVVASEQGRVFDVKMPILKGYAGSVQLGVSDRIVTTELRGLTRTLMKGLIACAGLGAVLALGLTHLLTKPIHHLVSVADRLREGDFSTRADADTGDEVGELARAFNQLAESLERYETEVEEKERTRVSLLQKIIQTQEEERKSISQELHDHLGQTLLALLLVIQSGKKKSEVSAPLAAEIDGKLRDLIDDIRRLAQGMRPAVLDDYGLEKALERLVADVSSYASIAIDYQYICPPDAPRMPQTVEVTLYRIAQEAIANIVRHSEATKASVVVLQGSDQATLIVEDQGRGFDIGVDEGTRARLGLSGMCERSALLGGQCMIDSEPGGGTTIRVEIPLER